MSFHLVPIISNQEVVIFHLAFELDKEQDHIDISVRVSLNESTETLGHTSKTWSARLEIVSEARKARGREK